MNRDRWTPVTLVFRKETATALRYLARVGDTSQSALVRDMIGPSIEELATSVQGAIATRDPGLLRAGLAGLLSNAIDAANEAMGRLPE